MYTKAEIFLLLIISCILMIIAIEILNIFEKSSTKNYIIRTVGFLLMVSGVRIMLAFVELLLIPKVVRNKIKEVSREAI